MVTGQCKNAKNKNATVCVCQLLLFGRAFNPGQTQTELGRRFILLLPQAAAPPGSDAGSDDVEPHRVS